MTWIPSPTFVDGQVLSASGHLQVLADDTRWLLGMYRRPQAIWPTTRLDGNHWNKYVLPEGDGWQRCFDGYVRNKTDALAYAVEVQRDALLVCKVRITAGASVTTTHTVAAGTGTQTINGTLDVSSLSGFYTVWVDVQTLSDGSPSGERGSIEVMPLYIEEIDEQSYADLHRFYTGDTPTASDWQALSGRDTILHAQTGGVVAAWTTDPPSDTDYIWGTSVYRNEFLRYDFRLFMPAMFPPTGGQEYATRMAVAYYGDTMVGARGWGVIASADLPGTLEFKDATYFYEGQTVELQTGALVTLGSKTSHTFTGCTMTGTNWRSPGNGDWLRHWPMQPVGDAENEYANYTGVFDLRGLGLVEGTRYQVKIFHYTNSHGFDAGPVGVIKVHFLADQPASNPTLAGWSAMPAFAHGDTVAGAGSVKTIRDNLAWLSSRIAYRNPAVLQRRWWYQPFWFINTKRWLHYFCIYEDGPLNDEPRLEIGWFVGAEWKTDTLPFEANRWLVFDLWGVVGLLPGYAYRVVVPGYAMEDDVP